MALVNKQDSKTDRAKKGRGKRQARKKEIPGKELTLSKKGRKIAKKDLALIKGKGKEKKDIVKKDSERKEITVKKDKVNRIEGIKRFLRGAYNEMKKVHWPNRRETVTYTVVVLVAVVIVGVLIWLFDSALSSILYLIMPR